MVHVSLFWCGMRKLLAILFLLGGLAYAQTPPPNTLPTDPLQVQTLLEQSGCRYEVGAAAQTIATLQKQINELQKKLDDKEKKK